MTGRPEFEVDHGTAVEAVLRGRHRFAIAVGGHPVIWHRSNGQAFHMTYASQRGAYGTLGRVQAVLPDAVVLTA